MGGFNTKKLSAGGFLITIGIVFGDIGTSPLYVFDAITQGNFDPNLVLGGLSSVIWTLILLATVKYIYLALNADNKGEGGIFALYALLKKRKYKWIIIPALIGCATLLADGFITPAISISSAVGTAGSFLVVEHCHRSLLKLRNLLRQKPCLVDRCGSR